MGARPLARVIQEHIKKPLADERFCSASLEQGGTVKVLVQGKGEDSTLTFEIIPGDPAKTLARRRMTKTVMTRSSEAALVEATRRRAKALPGPKEKKEKEPALTVLRWRRAERTRKEGRLRPPSPDYWQRREASSFVAFVVQGALVATRLKLSSMGEKNSRR